MTILGIDTSAGTCGAALMKDGKTLASFARRDGLVHSETLLPGILLLLDGAGIGVSDLDAVAVSVGPGSFTGLRIGVSTVKGLSYPGDIPCVPVSTLEALAENASSLEGKTVCALMDARRGEFYNAIFTVQGGVPRRIT
ncbi:MAG: tRNA (adenosine(37)-N6)-threonylcarbamoyltransferase complex dimerization subunit type 1 TsaB, partial [Clostridia bacterium]|nr:tRNA (adenosine(37)-N6)-threonylcarbamoyltransferase complex dimerization subunit type 1 TsaB [Clostridia bacterium]